MGAHARLSASGSSKWLNCPPSLTLEEQFEDKTSPYAAEGSLAHELAELKAQKYFFPMGPSEYQKKLKVIKEKEFYSAEMDRYTDEYLDYLKKIYMGFESKPVVAIEKRVNYSSYAPEGFGTADCVMVYRDTIYIFDLKYGKGVQVFAENNSQMMLYALGAYEAYKTIFHFKNVVVGVLQPRIEHFDTWELSVEDLLAFGEKVKETSNIALSGGGEAVSGSHCKFCKAKTICKEYMKGYIGLTPIKEEHPTPKTLSPDEVGEVLKIAIDLDKWVKGLKEYALSQILAGKDITGWKAVSGKSSRSWIDESKAFDSLEKGGIEASMLYIKKPLTLAQIEKMVCKKDFDEMVGSLVEKKEGAPTLVLETDKREAITNVVKAEDVFKED